LNIRSITEINQKIEKGEATVLSAEEVSQLVREGEEPKAEDIDVITTGTCGIMSGTAAILHIPVAEPGSFKKAKRILLNGVPGFPGPCPNEWLGSVDLMVYGTSHSIYDADYGGGFLLKDLVRGNEIQVEVESTYGEKIESTTTIDEMGTAKMLGIRMAFKNYTAFVNPTEEPISSIFHAIDMKGPYKSLSFSGCGELNPLQNDPLMKTVCLGSRVLLNGALGIVIGRGTRSSKEKPNMMITADMKGMDPHYLGGFKTSAGPEIFDSVALAIPVLNDDILKQTYIKNEDIKLPVADIRGRHSVLGYTNYGTTWNGVDERPSYDEEDCRRCTSCIVEERCPTGAYRFENLNQRKCFGCGMCVCSCPYGAFKMKTGSVDLEVQGEKVNLPISCRQSDIKRARELATELKKRILKGEFRINPCYDPLK
jgi:L-aspartate semialdehyde sulfurtransferase